MIAEDDASIMLRYTIIDNDHEAGMVVISDER
jgi:hypothetical protein